MHGLRPWIFTCQALARRGAQTASGTRWYVEAPSPCPTGQRCLAVTSQRAAHFRSLHRSSTAASDASRSSNWRSVTRGSDKALLWAQNHGRRGG